MRKGGGGAATSAAEGCSRGALNSWSASAHNAWANAWAEAMAVAVEVGCVDFDDGDFDRMGTEELIPRRVTVTAFPHTSQGAASHTCDNNASRNRFPSLHVHRKGRHHEPGGDPMQGQSSGGVTGSVPTAVGQPDKPHGVTT